jgi:CheY-like chemotaxis protein
MGGDRRFELLTADSGGAGLELARRHQPELILLDLDLAGTPSGPGVLGELEHDPSTAHIPIVVLTRDPEPMNWSRPGPRHVCGS